MLCLFESAYIFLQLFGYHQHGFHYFNCVELGDQNLDLFREIIKIGEQRGGLLAFATINLVPLNEWLRGESVSRLGDQTTELEGNLKVLGEVTG